MNNKPIVVYIPGLGDRRPRFQRFAVWMWRMHGVRSHTYVIGWDDKTESYEDKLARLLNFVDSLPGATVSLVGSSAGATAVLNVYAARRDKITGVVAIAGKINHPETIGEAYQKRSPSFVESANAAAVVAANLSKTDKTKFLSVYSQNDSIVPARDSHIVGATNIIQSKSAGHALTIALGLTWYSRRYLKFIKSKSTPAITSKPLQAR